MRRREMHVWLIEVKWKSDKQYWPCEGETPYHAKCTALWRIRHLQDFHGEAAEFRPRKYVPEKEKP